eukprot:13161968-Alexandrium_andersonii.AAC.1
MNAWRHGMCASVASQASIHSGVGDMAEMRSILAFARACFKHRPAAPDHFRLWTTWLPAIRSCCFARADSIVQAWLEFWHSSQWLMLKNRRSDLCWICRQQVI